MSVNYNANTLGYRAGIHFKMFGLSKILLSKRPVNQSKIQCFNILLFKVV